MSQERAQPDLDLDEDLFDFPPVEDDHVASQEDLEEVFASLRDDPLEEDLLAVPSAAPLVPRAPPAPARPTTAPPETTGDEHERTLEPAPAVRSWRPARLSRSVLAIALSVTLLNGALAVVVLRRGSEGPSAPSPASAGRPEHGVSSGSEERYLAPERDHEGDTLAASPRETTTRLAEPETIDPENALHAHPTLDEAREQISRGEYAVARQRVYGLLSIIDRLEDPRRSALEADCQFLIAQALHLEALDRMGGPE